MTSLQTVSKKMYVLDTNVLLHDPRAMFSFADSLVGIPIMVLEELEKFKRENSGRGKSAREAVRYLDQLREKGHLNQGVDAGNGGLIRILFSPQDIAQKPILSLSLADNLILLTALSYKEAGYDVRFISKDLNARVKADALGLESEDYLKGHVAQDEFYKGWVRVQVPSVQLKQEIPDAVRELAKSNTLSINEYVLVESQHNPHNYRVLRYTGSGSHKEFIPVALPHLRWPIEARNPQQLMALNALFDPSLEFVSLLGPAGTGKTFLALLAGLHQVLVEDMYQKMLVTRPVVPLGPDIGYLPGDIQEKLHIWMQPVYDNIEVIVHSASMQRHLQDMKDEAILEEVAGKKKSKKKMAAKKVQKGGAYKIVSVEDLITQHKLSLEAITYMRGRSIPYQFILIDEVQNLSPHEVKTLVSRVGQGSKIVLCGDPYQIDSPYLDFSSNGLVVASDKFKDQSLFATVFLDTSERSTLSRLASELL